MKSEEKDLIINIVPLPLEKEMIAGEIPSYSEQLRLKKESLEKKFNQKPVVSIQENQGKIEDSAESYSSEISQDKIK